MSLNRRTARPEFAPLSLSGANNLITLPAGFTFIRFNGTRINVAMTGFSLPNAPPVADYGASLAHKTVSLDRYILLSFMVLMAYISLIQYVPFNRFEHTGTRAQELTETHKLVTGILGLHLLLACALHSQFLRAMRVNWAATLYALLIGLTIPFRSDMLQEAIRTAPMSLVFLTAPVAGTILVRNREQLHRTIHLMVVWFSVIIILNTVLALVFPGAGKLWGWYRGIEQRGFLLCENGIMPSLMLLLAIANHSIRRSSFSRTAIIIALYFVFFRSARRELVVLAIAGLAFISIPNLRQLGLLWTFAILSTAYLGALLVFMIAAGAFDFDAPIQQKLVALRLYVPEFSAAGLDVFSGGRVTIANAIMEISGFSAFGVGQAVIKEKLIDLVLAGEVQTATDHGLILHIAAYGYILPAIMLFYLFQNSLYHRWVIHRLKNVNNMTRYSLAAGAIGVLPLMLVYLFSAAVSGHTWLVLLFMGANAGLRHYRHDGRLRVVD